MRLVWTPEAREDRRAIYSHIEPVNLSAAIALDEVFSRRAAQLGRHPLIGRPGRVAQTRELVVHRNYVIIYDISDERVRLLRILHAAQEWPRSADS